jgi:hypothetical protein
MSRTMSEISYNPYDAAYADKAGISCYALSSSNSNFLRVFLSPFRLTSMTFVLLYITIITISRWSSMTMVMHKQLRIEHAKCSMSSTFEFTISVNLKHVRIYHYDKFAALFEFIIIINSRHLTLTLTLTTNP